MYAIMYGISYVTRALTEEDVLQDDDRQEGDRGHHQVGCEHDDERHEEGEQH